jgi:hypothetical protein
MQGPAAVFETDVDPNHGGAVPIPGMGRWQAGTGGGLLRVPLAALELLASEA